MGFATYQTTGAYKNIKLTKLSPDEAAKADDDSEPEDDATEN